MKFWRLLLATTVMVVTTSVNAIPILIFDGNEVIGVNNIQVGGETFVVKFMDGVFINLYPDGIDPIFFQNIPNVVEAANQIGDAFSTDVNFNDVDQIRGCESAPLAELGPCGILFPFDVIGSMAINGLFAIEETGFSGFSAFDAGSAETLAGVGPGPEDLDNLVFAVVTTVPEPTTLTLVGIGLAGLGFVRRMKTASS